MTACQEAVGIRGYRVYACSSRTSRRISAEILFARNVEIKVVAPSLGDTVVENVLSPPEVPCAQESHRAPDSRLGPARDADHRDRSPSADQPTDRAQVSRGNTPCACAQAQTHPAGFVSRADSTLGRAGSPVQLRADARAAAPAGLPRRHLATQGVCAALSPRPSGETRGPAL